MPATNVCSRHLLTAAVVLAATFSGTAAAQQGRALDGTFRVLPGVCADGPVKGSSFRLVEPGGNVRTGPFFDNPDSPCARQTVTPLRPGTDGGLVTGRFQGSTTKAFDGTGNSRLGRITRPARFGGIDFGLGTFARTPGTTDGPRASAPTIRVRDGRLSGTVTSFTAAWNGQWFNQGAPKPDGGTPGLTSPITGTYKARTGTYTLQWTSTVTGGPFRGFTGVWRLQGRFVARG